MSVVSAVAVAVSAPALGNARLVLAQQGSASICERIHSEFGFVKDRRCIGATVCPIRRRPCTCSLVS